MHSFIAGTIDRTLCLKCKRDEISHTAYAQCEACPNRGICEIFNDMLLCMGCFTRESIAGAKAKREAPSQSVQANQPIMPQVKPNESVAIQRLANKLHETNPEKASDYFNAKTSQLVDLEAKFLADESIPVEKRQYEFAKHVVNMHNHLTPILFEAIDVQLQVMSEQQSMTVYLNSIANKLRTEERAAQRLMISNINRSLRRSKLRKLNCLH